MGGQRARGVVRVYPIGAVTRGLGGRELAELGELAEAGCVAYSDDGKPVMNSALLRRALEYAQAFGRPIISHAEDAALSEGGVMHEGFVSTDLGLRGIPAAAEEIMVARDIALADLTGTPVHIAHVSTAAAVRRIGFRRWKRLQRLAYVAGVLAVVHFVLRVKADLREPAVYGVVLGVLLAARIALFLRRRAARAA